MKVGEILENTIYVLIINREGDVFGNKILDRHLLCIYSMPGVQDLKCNDVSQNNHVPFPKRDVKMGNEGEVKLEERVG